MNLSEEALKIYEEEFQEKNFFVQTKKLNTMKGNQYETELRSIFCDNLLNALTIGFYSYDDINRFGKEVEVKLFISESMKLYNTKVYFTAVAYFFEGDFLKSSVALKRAIKEIFIDKGKRLTQNEFIAYFVLPFKNGFKGFWNKLTKMIKEVERDKIVDELCQVLNVFYNNGQDRNCLLDFLQKNPDNTLIKELLGITYYEDKMWKNAIALFEQIIENKPYMYYLDEILFCIAYSYEKCKDYKKALGYYEKALENYDESPWALNNLGSVYYSLKQYNKALEIFQQCIDKKQDFPNAVGNYIRTLLKLGKIKEAKQFVSNTDIEISKFWKDKVEKTDNKNFNQPEEIDNESLDEEIGMVKNRTQNTSKSYSYQFSSEKVLEDELTAQLEAGRNVFGIPLKIYQRKGEYGRQYIIPIGRLDLLTEDENGNLYIIELKKDSGYGDVYKQITSYIDWFQENRRKKNQKVFGIICLNNPSKKLINQVKKDARVRLFEYQLFYKEIL